MKNDTITDFFTNTPNIIQNDIKDSFYKIRIILNNLKKKILKFEILQNGNMLNIQMNYHFYNYVIDIFDTKTYRFEQITPNKTLKHVWIVKFDNKTLEVIQLLKIYNHSDIIKTMYL